MKEIFKNRIQFLKRIYNNSKKQLFSLKNNENYKNNQIELTKQLFKSIVYLLNPYLTKNNYFVIVFFDTIIKFLEDQNIQKFNEYLMSELNNKIKFYSNYMSDIVSSITTNIQNRKNTDLMILQKIIFSTYSNPSFIKKNLNVVEKYKVNSEKPTVLFENIEKNIKHNNFWNLRDNISLIFELNDNKDLTLSRNIDILKELSSFLVRNEETMDLYTIIYDILSLLNGFGFSLKEFLNEKIEDNELKHIIDTYFHFIEKHNLICYENIPMDEIINENINSQNEEN
jgi:hypothetical protein